MFKINESIIVIQAEAINPIQTNVVFWSHDRGTAKLRMKLVGKNGIPQSLPEGTTVPIRLMFKSATAEGGYGKHDYLATIEDRVNGIVSIVLEDNILGYVGTVEGSVYIDFPNDRSLDTAGRFTFYIKRSPIDDSTPELEDYYFNGFSQTIDKIEKILADGKQEIEQKIAESETQIDAKLKDTNDKITKANQDVATLNTNIDKANDRIDQTNQQIGDLGKLKKMYSNSIDFGDYDYSTAPNLMRTITFSDLSTMGTPTGRVPTGVTDKGDYFEIDLTTMGVNEIKLLWIPMAPRPQLGKQYTYSIELMCDEGEMNEVYIRPYFRNADGTSGVAFDSITKTVTSTWKRYSRLAGKASDSMVNSTLQSFQLYFPSAVTRRKLYVRYNIMVQEGDQTSSQTTGWKPNLLDAPYYLSKVALGENIANKNTKFPINTSEHSIYNYDMEEPLIIGQTYTLTVRGEKSSTQTFMVYNDASSSTGYLGNLKPVEGLTNTWELTFTPTTISTNIPKRLRIFQQPQSTVGPCQIDWLKIEKGDTRTPNISQFKYFGEGLKDSNNPNDYSWDVTPEYTEKGLNNTVSLTEPETVLGLKNFKDGAQIDGVDVATVKNLGSVLQSGSGLTTIQSDKQSAFDEFSYEFERIGDRVFFHARVKTNSTTAVASHVNLLEIPLGFQFPIGWTIVGVPLSVVQWTTPQGEISALVITDSTGKQVVKFATNRVGNHYISGEWRTADSYPKTK
ncbi:BppU family phage baseplate upper protein [Enterococcus faecium]|uniref:BppU family phage baseplate upper protein n=1 Tax=Enterococcus faecium TaxID=1352 RepID=UPI00292EC495|nr:BppU family phage baseplate upper protein [Enterococcus faecium]